jgi:hypothetical protein
MGFNSKDYSIPNIDFGFGSGSSSTSSTKSGGFDWSSTINSAIGLGSTIYANETQRKLAQQQANALIAQGISQERVAQMLLEGKRLDLETAKAGGGSSDNKTLYIALGIGGVVILSLVIFVVTRKK